MPTPQQSSTPGTPTSVQFTVRIPVVTKPAGRRRAGASNVYISPATATITIGLTAVNGAPLANPPTPTTAALADACRATPCSLTVTVPARVGSDVFTVTTAAKSGAIISRADIDVPVNASAGVTQTLGPGTTLSIGGYVAQLALSAPPGFVKPGPPSSLQVYVTALDAGGATIVGLTQYANPITLSVTGDGFSLAGGGLVRGALSGPESGANPVTLFYSGLGTGGTVTASSIDGSGKAISASTTVVIADALPTAAPTLPPVSTTNDIYVANGGDNTIAEFSQDVVPTSGPRRIFGGQGFGCPPDIALEEPSLVGLTVDARGMTYAGFVNGGIPGCSGAVALAFDPAAVGKSTGNYSLFGFGVPNASTTPTQSLGMRATDDGHIWESDDADLYFAQEVKPNNDPTNFQVATTAILGRPSVNGDACITSPGLPNAPVGGDPCLDPGFNFFASFDAGYFFATNQIVPAGSSMPLGIEADGSLIFPSIRVSDAAGPAGLAFLQILKIKNQASTSFPVAASSWLDIGIETDVNLGPLANVNSDLTPRIAALDSISLDPTSNIIYLLITVLSQGSQGLGGPANCSQDLVNGTGACLDGNLHYYIVGYNLSAIEGKTGPVATLPVVVLGGDTIGHFGPSSLAVSALPSLYNALTVSNGRIYVANPYGPDCDATCMASPVGRGEIDVYDTNTRGIHINDVASAPLAVIKGAGISNPTAVAIGPRGVGLGSAGLRPMPQAVGKPRHIR